MKKLFVILLTIMLLLTACVQTEAPALPDDPSSEESSEPTTETPEETEKIPTNKFEIRDAGIRYPKGGFVYEGAPQLYGDTVLFVENQQDGRGEGKKGNVFTYDLKTDEVTPYNIYAYGAVHLYGGNIYYREGEIISFYNIETGETKPLETGITAKGSLLDYSSFWNEYAILCDWNSGGEGVHTVYSYNLETGETVCLAENIQKRLNEFTGRDFSIKNGYAAYITGKEIYAVDIKTGENTLLKTLDKAPLQEKVIYNGKYLLWFEGETVKVLENGKERVVSEGTWDLELVQDKLAVCGLKDSSFKVYDLESRTGIYSSKENYPDIRYDVHNLDFTSDDGIIVPAAPNEMYLDEYFTEDLYPDWNWDSQGQYADAPHGLARIYIYQYPEDTATAEEMFNLGEGASIIKLDVDEASYHIENVIETEKYLIYTDGYFHKICDKLTGEVVYTEDYSDFYKDMHFSWKTELCTEKEGFDYRILFTDGIVYRSLSDFTKSETVMLTEYIEPNSPYYKMKNNNYGINAENTFVTVIDGSVVMKKEGEEPKVILEKGYFSNTYDFYKEAKGVPEGKLKEIKENEYYQYPVYFNDPRFACGGTKLIVSVEDEAEYNHGGTIVYNVEKEEIEYCFYGLSIDIQANKYPIDDRYIQYTDIIWDAETGQKEELPGKGFIVVPNSGRNLLLLDEGKQPSWDSTLFDFKGYTVDRETGEKTEFISTKEGGYSDIYLYAVTENYYIIRVEKESDLDFYAVKFR